MIYIFTDIHCKHRRCVARRESPFIAYSGSMSPPVSAWLGFVFVYEDGGDGMSVYITVEETREYSRLLVTYVLT